MLVAGLEPFNIYCLFDSRAQCTDSWTGLCRKVLYSRIFLYCLCTGCGAVPYTHKVCLFTSGSQSRYTTSKQLIYVFRLLIGLDQFLSGCFEKVNTTVFYVSVL